ncbi:MAG: hypothetical protein WCS86_01985 [Candidatus Paceibacterota bacterium]
MSRKNIILLVLFLVVISCAVGVYLYIENQNLTKNTEERTAEQKTAEQLRQEAVMTELNSFKLDPANVKTETEVTKELNSFKAPTVLSTTTGTVDDNSSNVGVKSKTQTKPKTEAEVMNDLNSFKAPDINQNDILNSLNNFKP